MTEQRTPASLVVVAACALLDRQGRVLITKRPEGKPMAGLWEFPGGKLERFETPEGALIRELNEELGIVITPSALQPLAFASHAYADFHLLMPVYGCWRWAGEVTPQEGQQIAWVEPADLATYDMPPADKPLQTSLLDLLQHGRGF